MRVYKKRDTTDVSNYCLVSIFIIISKVFERVIYDQFDAYLTEKKLLYKFYPGFKCNFSTDTCLLHLSDYSMFQNDKGNFVGMVLLDLQNALTL